MDIKTGLGRVRVEAEAITGFLLVRVGDGPTGRSPGIGSLGARSERDAPGRGRLTAYIDVYDAAGKRQMIGLTRGEAQEIKEEQRYARYAADPSARLRDELAELLREREQLVGEIQAWEWEARAVFEAVHETGGTGREYTARRPADVAAAEARQTLRVWDDKHPQALEEIARQRRERLEGGRED